MKLHNGPVACGASGWYDPQNGVRIFAVFTGCDSSDIAVSIQSVLLMSMFIVYTQTQYINGDSVQHKYVAVSVLCVCACVCSSDNAKG